MNQANSLNSFKPRTASYIARVAVKHRERLGAETGSSIDASTSCKFRHVTRKQEWENGLRAIETNCRLDNLHLRLENYIESHGVQSYSSLLTSWRNGAKKIVKNDSTNPPIVSPIALAVRKGRGRPKKVFVNRLRPYLQDFTFPGDALSKLPMFDDVVAGVVVADAGGNTRPFSKSYMVSLLQKLEEISTESVLDEMQCSERHAQKVAMCLRIIERHCFEIAQDYWTPAIETDWTGID